MIRTKQALIIIGDCLALGIAFGIMILLRFDSNRDAFLILAQIRIFTGLFIGWILIFYIFDLYTIRRITPTPRSVGLLGLALSVAVLISSVFFYLFPNTLGIAPKLNLLLVGLFSFGTMVLWRRYAHRFLSTAVRYRIVLIGEGQLLAAIATEITQNPHIGTITNHYSTIPQTIDTSTHLIITETTDYATIFPILQSTHAELLSVADAYELLFGKVSIALLTDTTALHLIGEHDAHHFYAIRRFFEILIAGSVLLLTSPLLIIAGIAIYIEDRGPIVYTQRRVGRYGALFTIYKLRSMHIHAEQHGAQWATTNDPRTTLVGAFLRKTHIDELLQMINIIKGELALVGPRPERPEFVSRLEQEIPYYALRHTIRPGFTGWAQIKFHYARTDAESREKFAYDLYYIKHQSLLLDSGILLKTLQIIFTH